MHAYNSSDFDPPAPVALVTFADPNTDQQVDDIPMLLDMGADATVVPQSVVDALNASPRNIAYEIEYLQGDTSTLSSVHLQMRWLGHNFTGDFLVAQASYGTIGRNILNHLRLTFDGPALQWDSG